MNNSVYSGRELIGFRCFTCGNVCSSMWGTKCNGCREKERQHDELMLEMKKLREAISAPIKK